MNTSASAKEIDNGDIDEAIGEYAMLSHPFYQLWADGNLTKAMLAEYARQYYAHVTAFPTYVSAVHSRCDDLEVRQLLLENLIEVIARTSLLTGSNSLASPTPESLSI